MHRSAITPAKIIFFLLTVACMALIFFFSCEDAENSSRTSGTVTEIAVKITVPHYNSLPHAERLSILDKAEHIVRKLAHFTIFTALGFCASCTIGKRRLFSAKTLGVLIFCFLYACSDEFHQKFSAGRSCQFTDVLIDTSGSLCGIIFSLLIIFISCKLKTKFRQNSTKHA